MTVKRTFDAYLYSLGFIIIATFSALRSVSETGQVLWTVNIGLGLVSLLSMVIRRNCFELRDNRLKINKDFFFTKHIDIYKIDKIKIGTGLFDSSAIILKDKSKIRFHSADNKGLKELMGQLNIPIE